MKLITVTFLLFCTTGTYAQEIPKKASIIVVKGAAFDKAVTYLADSSGFEMKRIDKENQSLRTKFKKICKDCSTEVSFTVRVLDSVATISGKWRYNNGGRLSELKNSIDDEEFVYDIKNEKGKFAKEAFSAMNEFALALKGEILYKVQSN
jgi:hypothetical protein